MPDRLTPVEVEGRPQLAAAPFIPAVQALENGAGPSLADTLRAAATSAALQLRAAAALA
jgi:hypothetical protein